MYHVTSRGNARNDTFRDDEDRGRFLSTLAAVVERYHWLCHAYCLMDNHYHLLIETPEGNLSRGMRQLNGVYTQASNRRHGEVGHVFQGRFKAILVDKDSYLKEVCRYVVLNPVRAGMVERPEAWRWSSYAATAGLSGKPEFLTVDWLLGCFGGRAKEARRRYRDFVAEGVHAQRPWSQLSGQLILGSDDFKGRMEELLTKSREVEEFPREQRYASRPPLKELLTGKAMLDRTRRERLAHEAVMSHGYTLKEVADHLNVHYATVSKMVKRSREEKCQSKT